MHCFRNGRVREYGVSEINVGEFALARYDIALNQLGDFRADHMGAKQLTGLLVEHGFHHAVGLAHGDGLAIANERKAADLDIVALFFRGFLSQADTGDLRVGIGTAGDV